MPFLREFWQLTVEMAPYLLFGLLAAGLLKVFLSPEAVARHLGGRGWREVFEAAIFGIPLPLCSCGVLPTGIALSRQGASRGATVAFLISTPQTGVDSILVTYGMLGPVLAVAGRRPIHLSRGEKDSGVPKIHQLWLDIGAKDKDDALKRISIGDPITPAVNMAQLPNDRVTCRGLDDKIGAFVVAEALRLAKEKGVKIGVYAVSTVQEEVGLRGARTSTFGVDPQVGIAVDVTFSTDNPGTEGEKKKLGEIKLGGGPVVARGANVNPKRFDLLVDTAEKEGIPYQIEAAPGATGTDANAMQLTRAGVATALVSIPNRYMHSPCEIVSLKDLENAAKLIAHTVARISTDTDLIPG